MCCLHVPVNCCCMWCHFFFWVKSRYEQLYLNNRSGKKSKCNTKACSGNEVSFNLRKGAQTSKCCIKKKIKKSESRESQATSPGNIITTDFLWVTKFCAQVLVSNWDNLSHTYQNQPDRSPRTQISLSCQTGGTGGKAIWIQMKCSAESRFFFFIISS